MHIIIIMLLVFYKNNQNYNNNMVFKPYKFNQTNKLQKLENKENIKIKVALNLFR